MVFGIVFCAVALLALAMAQQAGQEAVHRGGNLRSLRLKSPARRPVCSGVPTEPSSPTFSTEPRTSRNRSTTSIPASGKSAQLIAANKLAALAPSTSNLKDDRQRETSHPLRRCRLPMVARFQKPSLRCPWPALDLRCGRLKRTPVHRCRRAFERSQVFAQWKILKLPARLTISTCVPSPEALKLPSQKAAMQTC